MEQVAGQQTRCRVCVAWYKKITEPIPVSSLLHQDRLSAGLVTTSKPTKLFLQGNFFSRRSLVVCSHLQRTNSNVGELCQRTSRHFSCY